MKKRDYLSPHTWQQSDIPDLGQSKGPRRIGRYLAILILLILIASLAIRHHEAAKRTLISREATLSPLIQTISLPDDASSPNPNQA